MSDTPQPRSFVLLPGEGRTIDLATFRMCVKAGHAETGGAFALLEAEEPPGFGPPLHIHRDAAEAFYVTAGEYIILLEGDEVACPAGSFIFISAEGERLRQLRVRSSVHGSSHRGRSTYGRVQTLPWDEASMVPATAALRYGQ